MHHISAGWKVYKLSSEAEGSTAVSKFNLRESTLAFGDNPPRWVQRWGKEIHCLTQRVVQGFRLHATGCKPRKGPDSEHQGLRVGLWTNYGTSRGGKNNFPTNSCKGYLIFCLGGLGFGKTWTTFSFDHLCFGAAREEYSQRGNCKIYCMT